MKFDTSYDGDFPPSFSWKDSVAGSTWVGGTITHIGDPFVSRNYSDTGDEEKFAIVLDDAHTLWITSKKDMDRNPRPDRKYQAIAAAVHASGADELLVGGELRIKHSEDRKTPKGNPEKIYAATYTPPAKGVAMASATPADDEAPF